MKDNAATLLQIATGPERIDISKSTGEVSRQLALYLEPLSSAVGAALRDLEWARQ